jgi:hypothetical protein
MGSTHQLATLQPLPDFTVPVSYENWRVEQLGKGFTRAALAQQLEQQGDELALMRAAQIISVESAYQDEAFRLAGLLMCAENPLVRMYGRYQTAFLVMRGGFQNDPEAPITAQTAIPTLLDLLPQLDGLQKHNLLSLELEMRIHMALAESYMISENWELAYTHAAKATTLAPSVGLITFRFSAKTLVATALLYRGHSTAALKMFHEIQNDPTFKNFKAHIAVNLALALFWSGDAIGAVSIVAQYQAGNATEADSELTECAKCVRTLTLQFLPEEVQFDLVPNRLAMLAQAHLKWQQAFSESPFSEEKRVLYREARSRIAHSFYNSDTWASNYERSFTTLCCVKAGDYGIALQTLPKIIGQTTEPLWARVLALFVTLETAIRSPHQAGKYSLFADTIPAIQEVLRQTETLVTQRLVLSLQLLTPWALAFMASLGGMDDAVVSTGLAAIVNISARPANVYGVSGIRPIQIAELTLEAFGIGQLGSSRIGGGQLEALTNCLRRPFGECHHWFEPVLPARLAVALLEAANTASLSESLRDSCQRSAIDISRTFGLIPQLQKTVIPKVLLALENDITRALYGNLSVSQIWHTVEGYQGGKV